MSQIRKTGSRKTDLSGESASQVLKTAKQMIRTDFGGKDAEEQIRKKALKVGIKFGPKSCKFIKEFAEQQVESCRKRTFPRMDEVISRLDENKKSDIVESAP